MAGERKIASAVLRIFRAQRRSGRERFGDWNRRLWDALHTPIMDAYVAAMRKVKLPKNMIDDAVAAAEQRVIELARLINDGTTSMLAEGRDADYVLGADRAAMIGASEVVYINAQIMAFSARARGGKVRWIANEGACPDCKSLHGKIKRVGQEFVAKSGARALHPTLHPNCVCTLEVVR